MRELEGERRAGIGIVMKSMAHDDASVRNVLHQLNWGVGVEWVGGVDRERRFKGVCDVDCFDFDFFATFDLDLELALVAVSTSFSSSVSPFFLPLDEAREREVPKFFVCLPFPLARKRDGDFSVAFGVDTFFLADLVVGMMKRMWQSEKLVKLVQNQLLSFLWYLGRQLSAKDISST